MLCPYVFCLDGAVAVKVLFKDGLCGGDTRSTLHTKLGEQPHQLTLELAEGKTWIDEVRASCGRRAWAPGYRKRVFSTFCRCWWSFC